MSLSKLSIDTIEAIEQKLENVLRLSTANSESIAKLVAGEIKIVERGMSEPVNLNNQQVFIFQKFKYFLTKNLNDLFLRLHSRNKQ